MSALLAIVSVLLVGAITPGPNNFIVMRAAAERGWGGALPAISGVVAGSVCLLALALAGVGAAITTWPALRALIGIVGALYLGVLGLRLLLEHADARDDSPPPIRTRDLFALQFLNPKGWLMMLAVAATAANDTGFATFAWLAPLTIAITSVCLLLWAFAGHALAAPFARPHVRRWIDRALGALLIAGALALFV
jgi:threonine/homoserine/homoserine lactone efflux protein